MLKKTITFFVLILLSINFISFGANETGSLKDMRVCLDAGWGINKSKRVANAATEANLRIAFFLQEMLEDAGAYVAMTDFDTLDLKSGEIDSNLLFLRATKVARGEKCSMVISIQHGISLDKNDNHYSVIFEPQNALKIKEYAMGISNCLKQALNRPNNSLKDIDNLKAFSSTDIPIIYINCGLITNKKERKELKKIDYCRLKAEAIFNGIVQADNILKSKINSPQISKKAKSYQRIIPPPIEEAEPIIISEDIDDQGDSEIITDEPEDKSLIEELPPPEVASLPVAEEEKEAANPEPEVSESEQIDYQPISEPEVQQDTERIVESTVKSDKEVAVKPVGEQSVEAAVKEASAPVIEQSASKPAPTSTKPAKLPVIEPIAEPIAKPVPASKPFEKPIVKIKPAPQPAEPTPQPQAVAQTVAQPETQQAIVSSYKDGQYYPFTPPFPSPIDAQIDNSWLYGERFTQDTYKKGVSFLAPKSTAIKAIADGVVEEINRSRYISKTAPYKKCIVIKHNDKYQEETVYSIYGKVLIIKVKKGQAVKKGDIIGYTGEPYAGKGSSRLEEFEFEIRFGQNLPEYRQNPELLIKQINGEGLGAVAGKVLKKTGKTAASVKIMGLKKPADIKHYGFTKSYTIIAERSKGFDENFAATGILPGKYTITTKYGSQEIEIKPDQLLYYDIKEK